MCKKRKKGNKFRTTKKTHSPPTEKRMKEVFSMFFLFKTEKKNENENETILLIKNIKRNGIKNSEP